MAARMDPATGVLMPFFVALTGKSSSTPLFDDGLLEKDITRVRIRDAVDTIKPLSGKERKWDKVANTDEPTPA